MQFTILLQLINFDSKNNQTTVNHNHNQTTKNNQTTENSWLNHVLLNDAQINPLF